MGIAIFKTVVRLGLTKKVIWAKLESRLVSNIDVKRKNIKTEGIASAKFLRQESAWQG